MKIWAPDPDTALFLSASSRPSHFGTTIYNELFRQLDLNSLYLSRKVTDARALASALRALDVRGCSVSMPLKSQVVDHLDTLDESARAVASVNTIVHRDGQLHGFNTDVDGFRAALPESIQGGRVLVYGSGSVTHAILQVLRGRRASVYLTARAPEKCRALCEKWGAETYTGQECDLFVNATPLSHAPVEEGVDKLLRRCARVFDLVVSPTENYLERWCRAHDRPYVSGFEMYKHQFVRQFSLYTGRVVSPDDVHAIARRHQLVRA
jgi:shikimate dehydrogenase